MTKKTSGGGSKPPRQTSSGVSSIASGILSGKINPTKAQMKSVAASALGQDQTPGQKKR